MKNACNLIISLCLLSFFITKSLISAELSEENRYWNQWRGPNMDGIYHEADPPINWSETPKDSVNVKWKAKIPGFGHSSPVIWKDRVFLLSAIEVGEKIISQSIIGSTFECFIESESHEYSKEIIIPNIKGSAFITGEQILYKDDKDPFPEGYRLNDTWPL